MNLDTDDKIKNSFIKVKDDISNLMREVEELKKSFLLRNNEFLMLKEQIKAQNELIFKLKAKIEDISIGNQRVINHHQSSSIIINDDQKRLIKPVIVEKFRHLTDREFSVFLAVYQLEEENGATTYGEISNKLGLTVVSTRGYINDLITRGLPIYGERIFNKKIKFRIIKEFREQNLISEVLSLREQKNIK